MFLFGGCADVMINPSVLISQPLFATAFYLIIERSFRLRMLLVKTSPVILPKGWGNGNHDYAYPFVY